MAIVNVWPGVTGGASALPAWSGRWSNAVADGGPWD